MRTRVLPVVLALGLLGGVGESHRSLAVVSDPRIARMCSVALPTAVCIQSITVNGKEPTILDPGSDTHMATFKVPGYESPEGTSYSDTFGIEIYELPSLFNVMVQAPRYSNLGMDPSWTIALTLNLRQNDVLYSMYKGPLDSYDVSRNDAGEFIASTVGHAAKQSFLSQATGQSYDAWIKACSAPESKANFDYPPFLYWMIAKSYRTDVPLSEYVGMLPMRGLAVSTNYGCGQMPIPEVDWKTKQMVVALAGPHFTATGDVNMGFFKAILPASYLIEGLGLSIDETLAKGVSLTTSYGTAAATSVPATMTLTPSGGVQIEATEMFHYSAPKFILKKSNRKLTGSTKVAPSSAVKKLTRGVSTKVKVSLPGVRSGKAYVYVADKKGVYTYLLRASISNGKAEFTVNVPIGLPIGKGRLIVSYGGSKKFARATLKQPVTIG